MSTATKGYPEPGNPCIGDQKAPIVITLVFALVLARTVALIIYRLYFSPLSQFPGSRLAAISGWHELYYDLIANGGGQFTFEIKRMHERYGPIVRINPDELHIDDPEFYNEINCGATAAHPIDKIRKFKYRFNVPEATVHTVYSEHHRMRRAAIAPFFSKQRIFSRNGHLQQIVDRISHRFDTEYKGTGKVVNMSDVWATMTADVITELAFARSTNFSAAPDFQSPFSMAMASSVGYAHWTTHFRPFVEMMNWIPDGILGVIVPPFKPILEYRQAISRQIRDILAGKNMDAKETSHPTIFHDILASDLPPEELSFSRLRQEAMSLNGAGIETTMWTLTVGTFHIIDNSDVYHKLKDELTESMPDPDVVLSWVALEKLPYLSAVVQESESTLPLSIPNGLLSFVQFSRKIAWMLNNLWHRSSSRVRLSPTPAACKPFRASDLWLLDDTGQCICFNGRVP
ncbi:hypothetical protein TruAng_002207 [Truncatella angustata]|nr:hypothetical protein TruAng_002207 [Truncatella angustata]